MMYGWHGLSHWDSNNLRKCAEAAELLIQADKDRRAALKAEQDAKTQAQMIAFLSHLKTLPGPTQPPQTSTYSE